MICWPFSSAWVGRIGQQLNPALIACSAQLAPACCNNVFDASPGRDPALSQASCFVAFLGGVLVSTMFRFRAGPLRCAHELLPIKLLGDPGAPRRASPPCPASSSIVTSYRSDRRRAFFGMTRQIRDR